MRNPRKTILALCLCAAVAFATACFGQAVRPAVPSSAPTTKPGKDELVQKNIIPRAVYAGFKDKIIAKQQ